MKQKILILKTVEPNKVTGFSERVNRREHCYPSPYINWNRVLRGMPRDLPERGKFCTCLKTFLLFMQGLVIKHKTALNTLIVYSYFHYSELSLIHFRLNPESVGEGSVA